MGRKKNKGGSKGNPQKKEEPKKQDEPEKEEEPKEEEPQKEEPTSTPSEEVPWPESGVAIETLQPGDGKTFPKKGDKLKMHYTGTLRDGGKQFDSSRDRGQLFEFTIGVGQVIKGWDEGVIQLSLGQRVNLKISSDFGYGANGAGSDIPPNADLNFDVELVGINGKQAYYSQATKDKYKEQMEKWKAKQLKKFDNPDKESYRAKKIEKHGDREGFEKWLQNEIDEDLARVVVK
jgi:FK506-binding protein 1